MNTLKYISSTLITVAPDILDTNDTDLTFYVLCEFAEWTDFDILGVLGNGYYSGI